MRFKSTLIAASLLLGSSWSAAQPPASIAEERDVLLQAAWELNEYVPPVVDGPASPCRNITRDEAADHTHNTLVFFENIRWRRIMLPGGLRSEIEQCRAAASRVSNRFEQASLYPKVAISDYQDFPRVK